MPCNFRKQVDMCEVSGIGYNYSLKKHSTSVRPLNVGQAVQNGKITLGLFRSAVYRGEITAKTVTMSL